MEQQAHKRTGEIKATTRILVVDDHPFVRHGLIQLLSRDPSLEVCGEADNLETALELVASLKPDLVTLDLSLRGEITGFEILSKMTELNPGVKVLVISMLDEAIYAENALQRGAVGFVEKVRSTEQLLGAVQDVLAGRMFVPAATRDRLLSRAAHPHRERITDPVLTLSPREMQVFELIGTGQSTEQISTILGLSSKTVHTHRQHIIDKLSVDSSSQLVVRAAAWARQNPKSNSATPTTANTLDAAPTGVPV